MAIDVTNISGGLGGMADIPTWISSHITSLSQIDESNVVGFIALGFAIICFFVSLGVIMKNSQGG